MRPTRALVLTTAGLVAAAVPLPWLPQLLMPWQIAALLLVSGALADAWLLARTPSPRITRRMSEVLPQRVLSPVRLEIQAPRGQSLKLKVHDLHPVEMEVDGLPATVSLRAGSEQRVDYRLRAPRRGNFVFPGCEVMLFSPFRFWQQRRRIGIDQRIRVFPNFAEISHYTLLAANDQLALLGVRRLQRRGAGAEFHQLREYRRGDSLRQIDWKATSRMRKLIAREYQDERDQRLVFLLDCGRRMRHRDTDGRGHLDESLNALLLLAYVAVAQGDSVGLMTFGGDRRWLAPRKDPDTVNRLLGSIYDLEAGLEASDPLTAARELLRHQQRRALVLFLTNARDEDQDELSAAIKLLSRRHLVVVANLRESILDEVPKRPITDRESALRYHSTQAYLAERTRAHDHLTHAGADVLDLRPSQLPIALVNQYFAIKRAGRL